MLFLASSFLVLSILLLAKSTLIVQGFHNSAFLHSRTMKQEHSSSSALSVLPKLIVFDLDNTLWTPELYQLRKHQRANRTPVAHKDVKLMEGAKAVLERAKPPNVQYAIASRTKSVDWAHNLLDQFQIRHLFDHVEIFPGNKKKHFSNIADKSGVSFQEMLFFDDARDGKYGNCQPVSEMGVLSVHCPNGLHTEDIFHNALERYKQWDRSPHTIVEWDGTLSTQQQQRNGKRREGVVKMVKPERRFGFIQQSNGERDLFFHFNNLPNDDIQPGDKLSFVVKTDPKNGKPMAADIQLNNGSITSPTVQMPVFSMNMPFAALLANGYKTLETRNGTMFVPYPEGTKMLLQVGRRTYPDGNKHIDVMKSGGLSNDKVESLKKLRPGFAKGTVVAIVELGKTYEASLAERSEPNFERNVAAYGSDSGKMVTEIKRVEYLKRPVVVSGQAGVFTAQIDKNAIPDGWLDNETTGERPYQVKRKDSSKAKAVVNNKGRSKDSPSTTGSRSKKPVYSISG